MRREKSYVLSDYIKDWIMGMLVILAMVFILALMLLTMTEKAKAHSWYPPECCSGQDCAPVTNMDVSTKKHAIITTLFGTETMDDKTKIMDSKDHEMHACLRHGRVVCIFLAPGN